MPSPLTAPLLPSVDEWHENPHTVVFTIPLSWRQHFLQLSLQNKVLFIFPHPINYYWLLSDHHYSSFKSTFLYYILAYTHAILNPFSLLSLLLWFNSPIVWNTGSWFISSLPTPSLQYHPAFTEHLLSARCSFQWPWKWLIQPVSCIVPGLP